MYFLNKGIFIIYHCFLQFNRGDMFKEIEPMNHNVIFNHTQLHNYTSNDNNLFSSSIKRENLNPIRKKI